MEPAYDAMTPWNETTDGDPAHPAVLFLHGFMGRREDWKPVVAALAEEYYCICPDLPGHGKNCLPGSGAGWEMAEAASGLMLLLNKYQIERCALVGYSMGGRLALYLAATYPKRFTRVVLESASPGLRTEEERAPRRQHDDNLADILENAEGNPEAFRDFLERWYTLPIFTSLQERPKLLAQLVESRQENSPARLAGSLRAMSTGRQRSLWDALEGITQPTLLAAGVADRKFTIIAEEMSALSSNIAVEVFDKCGHNVHLENSGGYTTAVKHFLAPLR
jgi:2-succinyl-6-hydroxy-2,4-cyclohexadiene-1-carboxylate synthase